jgi:hypothetical protein
MGTKKIRDVKRIININIEDLERKGKNTSELYIFNRVGKAYCCVTNTDLNGNGLPSQRNRLYINPLKDEAYLFYTSTQRIPRCKHSPLRL